MAGQRLAQEVYAGRTVDRVAELFNNPAFNTKLSNVSNDINELRAATEAKDFAQAGVIRTRIATLHPEYDNDGLINHLMTTKVLDDNLNEVSITDLNTMQKFFERGENVSYLTDLKINGIIQQRAHNVALERRTRAFTDKGKVLVNDYYQTNIPGVYAIGDIVKGPSLAHVASAEGILCVEKIAGLSVHPINYGNIPGCTYCIPEIASVGMTEKAAKEAGIEIKVGKFPFSASGKAKAAGASDGFVKVIFDAKYGEWLGAHMIGTNVTEMIAEVVVARNLETTGHEIINSIHPHPTMSEAIMEAAADAYGEVIHM